MSLSTVSSKGQITLPAEARRKVGIQPKDRVLIEVAGDGILIRRAPKFAAFAGFLGKGLSAERERRAMARHVADHVEKRR
jgi:AbrB family looped-hinge helix DNA binding protein